MNAQQIRDLIRSEVKKEVQQYIARQYTNDNSFCWIQVTGGNTLGTGQTGIKLASVSNVPSAYDPNVTTTFIDGIGRGVLYRNGSPTNGYVLIMNNSSSPNIFNNVLISNDIIFAGGPTPVPVSGTSDYVMCYVPG